MGAGNLGGWRDFAARMRVTGRRAIGAGREPRRG